MGNAGRATTGLSVPIHTKLEDLLCTFHGSIG